MIYLDNAATSYPKPASVIREVNRSIRRYCGNPGRSGHKLSLYSAEMVYRAREAISALLGVDNPEQIVFTLNATYAINLALKAEIEGPATVLTSDVEHNAVIRPLEALKKSVGIKTRTFSTDKDLEASIEKEIDDDTRFIVTTLRSNVTGQDVDLSTLKRVANRHHLTLILDASQYIGHKRIDLSGLDSYVLCAPFHKGLLGIQGGGFACFSSLKRKASFIEGGTGILSMSPEMPIDLPEGYEAGTLPTPAIVSCLYGIQYINSVGIEVIERHLGLLSALLCERLDRISDLRIFGRENGIISFSYKDLPSEKVSEYLAKRGVCTRAGLHCAPSVHKKLGTDTLGLCRISLSHFNTKRDIDAVYALLKNM